MTRFVAPGQHLLIDCYQATNLCDQKLVEQALREAAAACNATVLKIMLHGFGEECGITGVALLAESHISIHTWPETAFAAIDIFVCGTCNADLAINVFQKYFQPESLKISRHNRGET